MFFSHASGGKLAKKPGVEELLKYLKMRGFKIGLASSTREATGAFGDFRWRAAGIF